ALYRRALRGFRDALSELRAGLHLTDPPPAADAMAHRMHDLQGLAGTVGARLLQAAARDLHRALALGDHDATHAGRARVDAAGRDALREVDRMLAKDAPAP
ncbi:MAG TPA: Hpt domain-containing protein, partial [Burkholderiaceae bacterium]|nr:Hpt domain-containing protein [Burkholderiaceae bacterium]